MWQALRSQRWALERANHYRLRCCSASYSRRSELGNSAGLGWLERLGSALLGLDSSVGSVSAGGKLGELEGNSQTGTWEGVAEGESEGVAEGVAESEGEGKGEGFGVGVMGSRFTDSEGEG